MLEFADTAHDLPYEDTTALLQAEIERLEAELAARDAALAAPAEACDVQTARRIAELTAEVALRDETIAQLWDHLREREEAEAQARADWDEVHQLVEDLEARIGVATSPTDEERARWESERRAWEDRRAHLEAEASELRSRLSQAARTAASGPIDEEHSARLADLEAANRQLREACRRLPELEAAATEVEILREQMKTAAVTNDPCQSWSRPAVSGSSVVWPVGTGQSRLSAADLSPDERIRALRQHLREVHERELEERKNGQLKTRLSRIWKTLGR
jgi:hypothetical protein